MSEFFERQFYNEFKTLMSYFRSETSLNIRKLPIPFKKPILVEKLFVEGIEDEKYKILNKTFVTKGKKNSVKRNIYRNNGEIKGETTYTAKEGSVIVVTEENLRLPFRYEASDGNLDYVDYRTDKNKRTFIYSIPKKYLYRTQQTALVLSQHPKKGHYGGIQIVLTNGHTIYLYVVSLRNVRTSEGNIPLVTKTGIDYMAELEALQKYWLSKGIIFEKSILDLEVPTKGVSNLGYKVLEPTLEFKGIDEFSLDEREQMRVERPY